MNKRRYKFKYTYIEEDTFDCVAASRDEAEELFDKSLNFEIEDVTVEVGEAVPLEADPNQVEMFPNEVKEKNKELLSPLGG